MISSTNKSMGYPKTYKEEWNKKNDLNQGLQIKNEKDVLCAWLLDNCTTIF